MHQRKLRAGVGAMALGRPQLVRLPLLEAIHRRWQAELDCKTVAASTIYSLWDRLRAFVDFSERTEVPLTIANTLRLYLAYCESVRNRRDLKLMTKYAYSQTLARVLAPVLTLEPAKLQWKTRIRSPKRISANTAKENLRTSAIFIQTLLATADQLPVEVIRGSLPAITLRYPENREYVANCGPALRPLAKLRGMRDATKRRRALEVRERRAKDTSNKARSRLINLRIEVELLTFISQTGCNLTQALQLHGSRFRYQSAGDYLHLIVWKGRAKHAVELRVHKGYRPHFEEYIRWRSTIFTDDADGLTFPFVWNDGEKASQRTHWSFAETRKLMAALGQSFVPAQQLRKTVGNFVKRRASRQTAAELLGHTLQTFRESYEEVHHQAAVAELVNFWSDTESVGYAVGPGVCTKAAPQARADAAYGAPKPDCESAGGCLFCDKNRDLRSFDHVWNLASLHHLKLLELNADRSYKSHPNQQDSVSLTIHHVRAKLDALIEMGGEYAEWVSEARLRVDEGRYHPFYTATFNILQG